MGFVVIFLCAIFLIGEQIVADHQSKIVAEKMRNRGRFLELPSESEHRKTQMEIIKSIQSGDGKLYPKEMESLLQQNPRANALYVSARAAHEEQKRGKTPYQCAPYYDRNTFDPYEKFNKEYGSGGKNE